MTKGSRARFRHEDVSSVPSGWHVRTVSHEKHRVRVAFPPGRVKFGKPSQPGRLVSILHPVGENPCTLRSANPAELLVMGANPPRKRSYWKLFSQEERKWLKKIGIGASNVRSEEDVAAFKQNVRDLMQVRQRHGVQLNPAELLVMGANPQVVRAPAENPPPAAEIYEQFTGTPSEWVTVDSEAHMPAGDYAQLGDLLNLYVKPLKGGQVLEIRNFGGKPPLIVCDRSTRQMYFFKGNQDVTDALDTFGARDRGDGVYELGEGVRIDYQARKEHVAEPDEDKWKHYFGEEDGARPRVLFDSRHKRLLLEGGNYRIDGAWIRN